MDRLQYAIALERAGNHRRALDRLYDLADELSGDTKLYDSLLQGVDVNAMGSHLLVGLLTISRPDRDHLPSRNALVERVRERLQVLAPGRVEKLLTGID